jgi:hypothetical protein
VKQLLLTAAITLWVSGCSQDMVDSNFAAYGIETEHAKQVKAENARASAAASARADAESQASYDHFLDQCVKDGDTFTNCKIKLIHMLNESEAAAAATRPVLPSPPEPFMCDPAPGGGFDCM